MHTHKCTHTHTHTNTHTQTHTHTQIQNYWRIYTFGSSTTRMSKSPIKEKNWNLEAFAKDYYFLLTQKTTTKRVKEVQLTSVFTNEFCPRVSSDRHTLPSLGPRPTVWSSPSKTCLPRWRIEKGRLLDPKRRLARIWGLLFSPVLWKNHHICELLALFLPIKCGWWNITLGSAQRGGGGWGGGHEGQFSRNSLPVSSVGSHCEQFWHMQGSPVFDIFHPTIPLPTTASPTLQGDLKDGFGDR